MNNLGVVEKKILTEIDANRLIEYNKEIAKEVRLSGSEEELRAFKYVQRILEGFGLKTELTFNEAYISLPGPSKLRIGNTIIPCITHSMAPSTEREGLVGTVIDLGEFSTDNLSLVKGKIAIVEGIALPEVLIHLEAAGADGVIFVNGPYTHEMIVSTVWGSPTSQSISQMPKIPVISINDKSGTQLRAILRDGEDTVEIHTKVETKWTPIPTLTAEIKGNEEADQFVLFSGHIDSWHYGAMDNGSANATMLEVARVLSKFQGQLKRSIRFAFWSGHSHGRYAGSQAYSDTHWEDIHEHCVMYFYIDSVGGKGATILSESNCMAETKDIASQYVNLITGQEFIGSRYGKYADQSFWGHGVPSLFMGMSEQAISDDPMSQKVFQVFKGKKAGGFGWWWHTVEDTIDKIDPDNLKRDCEIYILSIFKVLTDPILPINQHAAVLEIKQIIKKYQETAGSRISLGLTMERITELESILEDFQFKKVADNLSSEVCTHINKSIMKISRYLVPLNYVGVNVFEHDAALGMRPIPSLSAIYELAEVEEDSHEFFLLRTLINRQVNKVNYQLKQAVKEAKNLQSIFEKGSEKHVRS